jgi:matrix metalloproteinase-14 (membrane-inserted)
VEGDNTLLCGGQVKLDTIVTMADQETYVFVGRQYWKMSSTSIAAGYPRSIAQDWEGLPDDLDASFTYGNKTFFTKGTQYWRFTKVGVLDFGYPKHVKEIIPNAPNKVDAAYVWAFNNVIYFFKDKSYWAVDPQKPEVAAGYPRDIKSWSGVPDNLDAAMTHSNGKTYFFKDGRYYRFDNTAGEVDTETATPFPRKTGLWWFGCPEESVRLVRAETVHRADRADRADYNLLMDPRDPEISEKEKERSVKECKGQAAYWRWLLNLCGGHSTVDTQGDRVAAALTQDQTMLPADRADAAVRFLRSAVN